MDREYILLSKKCNKFAKESGNVLSKMSGVNYDVFSKELMENLMDAFTKTRKFILKNCAENFNKEKEVLNEGKTK